MYQYRDSTFQFQHLTHSYYSLYNEWMDDEDLPPPDDPLGGNHEHLPTTTNINSASQDADNPAGSDIDPVAGSNVTQAISAHSNSNDNVGTQYWDYFDDEEDWEIFNKFNLQVESNGRIIYNHIVGQNVDSGGTTAVENESATNSNIPTDSDNSNSKDVDIISGSLFDPRVFTRIRKRVNGWNEMGEQIS